MLDPRSYVGETQFAALTKAASCCRWGMHAVSLTGNRTALLLFRTKSNVLGAPLCLQVLYKNEAKGLSQGSKAGEGSSGESSSAWPRAEVGLFRCPDTTASERSGFKFVSPSKGSDRRFFRWTHYTSPTSNNTLLKLITDGKAGGGEGGGRSGLSGSKGVAEDLCLWHKISLSNETENANYSSSTLTSSSSSTQVFPLILVPCKHLVAESKLTFKYL